MKRFTREILLLGSLFAVAATTACGQDDERHVRVSRDVVRTGATTHTHSHRIVIDGDEDSPAHVVDRMSLRDADYAIVTQRGEAALLIEGTDIVIQLTDRGISGITKELDEERHRKENNEGIAGRVIARTVLAAIRGPLQALLDHGMAYPVAEIESVEYNNGRLELRDLDGELIFEDVDINGNDIMEDFSVREARAFIRKFNEVKSP